MVQRNSRTTARFTLPPGPIRVAAISVLAAGAIVGLAVPAPAMQVKPDRNFAGDGRTALAMPGHQFATDVVIDGSTSYVVGNTPQRDSAKKYRIMIAKYGPGGHLDHSFGDRGRKYIDMGAQAQAYSGALTPDGGILIAGWASLRKPSALLVKLRPNGGFDRGFGHSGVVTVPLRQGLEWPLVEAEPDGDIWLAWSSVRGFDYDKFDADFRVMHFHPGGRVDRSFSGDGVKNFDFRTQDHTYFSTVDATGRFYVTGLSRRHEKGDGAASIVSVAETGKAYSRTVNPWGRRGSFPLTVDINSGGQVMLGLSPWHGPGWGAAQLSTDLTLDKDFGHAGMTRHDCNCTSTSGALTDQGLVLVGNAQKRQQQTVIAHFTNSGRWDRELGNSRYDLFGDWEYWVETEVDSAQRLVMVGTVKDRDGGNVAISRMRAV